MNLYAVLHDSHSILGELHGAYVMGIGASNLQKPLYSQHGPAETRTTATGSLMVVMLQASSFSQSDTIDRRERLPTALKKFRLSLANRGSSSAEASHTSHVTLLAAGEDRLWSSRLNKQQQCWQGFSSIQGCAARPECTQERLLVAQTITWSHDGHPSISAAPDTTARCLEPASQVGPSTAGSPCPCCPALLQHL
jgi:hypothetical protein